MRTVIAGTTFFLLACALAARGFPSHAGKLVGTVTDQSGGALGGARGIVHWDAESSKAKLRLAAGLDHDLAFQTDERGAYSVELPPGVYDVFVSSPAFYPSCSKLLVEGDRETRFDTFLKIYLTTVTIEVH